MDNLLKLPVVGSVNDVKGIRQLYEKIEIHIRGLQALGVEAQQHVNLCMKNADNDVTVTVTAHVVPIICSPLDYQAVQFARKKSCSFEGHCFVGTYFRRESRRRHSHWSRSAVEHCKWKGQKRRELACCNEHMIWMDIIWSCRECTSLRYSLSQYGGNTRTSD